MSKSKILIPPKNLYYGCLWSVSIGNDLDSDDFGSHTTDDRKSDNYVIYFNDKSGADFFVELIEKSKHGENVITLLRKYFTPYSAGILFKEVMGGSFVIHELKK